jgi:hypothetical protein
VSAEDLAFPRALDNLFTYVGKVVSLTHRPLSTPQKTIFLLLVLEGLGTVDSRLSARGLTALRLNRGNVFLKKKFYFP